MATVATNCSSKEGACCFLTQDFLTCIGCVEFPTIAAVGWSYDGCVRFQAAIGVDWTFG